MAMPHQFVCKLAEIETGRLKAVSIGRARIVLCRLPSGEVRAFSSRCPHQGANLAAGCIVGAPTADRPNVITVERLSEVVRCPWHGFEWDLVTGLPLVPEPARWPLRLRFYEVAIDGDNVVVKT
jgi:nitrite reductase/ring-hydroxylating ferredoxin subunit